MLRRSFGLAFAFATFTLLTGAAHAVSAPGYYERFLFKVDGSCQNIHTVWFHEAATWDSAALGPDAQGRPTFASLSVQIFSGGRYYAEYHEDVAVETTPSGVRYEDLYHTTRVSTWEVVGDQLRLAGLGVGLPTQLHGPATGGVFDGFRFQMNVALHDPRAVANPMNLGRTGTNSGPYGVSINEYCGVK